MKPRTLSLISAACTLTGAVFAEFAELYWMAAAFGLIAFVALWAAITKRIFG